MPPIDLFLALAELGVVVAFALLAIGLKALDRAGFLASVAVGYPILLGGGWTWFVIIAAFFVLGVGFTWYKYEYKKSIGGAQEKGGIRSWPNILANGGVAAIFGLAHLLVGGWIFAALFLGSLSAAAADTTATELGLLSRHRPRLISRPSLVVSPGVSGGVTAMGFLGSGLASLVIGVIAAILGVVTGVNWAAVVLVAAVGGMGGSLADSFVGAVFQRKNVCVVCGAPSESRIHCGQPTKYVSGLPFVENNIVNLVATVVGAALSAAIALLFV